MSFIEIVKQGKENRVAWCTSKRVEGKKNPVKQSVHLGVLSAAGTELLKSSKLEALPDGVLEALAARGISYSGNTAKSSGRPSVYLQHVRLDDLSSSRTQTVGTYRVLKHFAEQSGFISALRHGYGENSEKIFSLMCQMLDTHMRGYLVQDWAAGTPFEAAVLKMTPKAVSELLGTLEDGRLPFCRKWYEGLGHPSRLIKDSTHFCSRTSEETERELEEYGWDHHCDAGLRQFNVLSMSEADTGLPVYYRAYPGSINDVSTVTQTTDEMAFISPGAQFETWTDCGYFSDFNMGYMRDHHVGFIMEGRWNDRTSAILKEARMIPEESREMVCHGKYSYTATPCSYCLKYVDGRGHDVQCTVGGYVYYSKLEAAEKENAFMTSLNKWRQAFYNYDFVSREHAQEWLDTATDKFGKYLELNWNGGRPAVSVRQGNVANVMDRYGYHIILQSGAEYSAQELIDNNHARDPVEKLWKTMKNEFDFKSAKTKSDSTTMGQTFIVWGASILYRLMLNAARKEGVGSTVNELLAPLRKIQLEYLKDKIIPRRMTASAIKVVVAMKLEDIFPEFSHDLQIPVAERKKAENKKVDDKRGKKAKFPLKKKLK